MHRSHTTPVMEGSSKNPLHVSRSFSRLEPTPRGSPQTRSRASTLSNVSGATSPLGQPAATAEGPSAENADIFANDSGDDTPTSRAALLADDNTAMTAAERHRTFEQLPIEIRSLTERFLESLSSRVYKTPILADTLSEIFQEFYVKADTHIATHIATLSSRIGRGTSPTPSKAAPGMGSVGRPKPLQRKDSGEDPVGEGEQQMLTANEIHDRKKARKLLQLKQLKLEETVERIVCEKVYPKLWRHRSTDDVERDEKLRSRTEALAVLGVGLKDLLNNTNDISTDVRETTKEKEVEIRESLAPARDSLQAMGKERYPLGKMRHLSAAHKSIVDSLSRIFPASSSADEILPTVIYTLMTMPTGDLDVISNLCFIQRFRAAHRIDGEAAYCLVNLEAAISFLETVDISSLRADAVPKMREPSSIAASSNVSAAKSNTDYAADSKLRASRPEKLKQVPADPILEGNGRAAMDPPASPGKASHRISSLIQTQTTRLEAASDAVRDAVLDGADSAFDSINNTLDNSFRFLFGRLREQQQERARQKLHIDPKSALATEEGTKQLRSLDTQKVLLSTDGTASSVGGVASSNQPPDVEIPRTLEDAQRLVSSPSRSFSADGEEIGSLSGASSVVDMPLSDGGDPPLAPPPTSNPNPTAILPGRRPRAGSRLAELSASLNPLLSLSRDRSADSTRSGSISGASLNPRSGGGGPTSVPIERTLSSSSTASTASHPPPSTTTTTTTTASSVATTTNNTIATISPLPSPPPGSSGSGTGTNAAVESMRNLGNTLNPLNRLGGIGLPRFARGSFSSSQPPLVPSSSTTLSTTSNTNTNTNTNAASTPSSTSATTTVTASAKDKDKDKDGTITPQEAMLLRDASAVAALEDLKRTAPPLKRFLEMRDAGQLRIEDVEVLLRDYQRLAEALRGAIVG